jgi:hypothetical protein
MGYKALLLGYLVLARLLTMIAMPPGGMGDIHPEYHRLRYGAHVINLVAKAVLYGIDIDALEPGEREEGLLDSRHIAAFEALVRFVLAEEALKSWRRKGPVGKLHNLVTHI